MPAHKPIFRVWLNPFGVALADGVDDFKDIEKRFHDLRVELSTPDTVYFIQGFLNGPSVLVDTDGNQGVKHIGQGCYAANKGICFP